MQLARRLKRGATACAAFALAALAAPPASAGPCAPDARVPGVARLYSQGVGLDLAGTRTQDARRTAISAANVARLRVKWVYGLATQNPRFFPLVSEDTIFVGDTGRGLVALDRESGCERWASPHKGQIASAIVFDRAQTGGRLYFSDRRAGLVALDAFDGHHLWTAKPEGPRNPLQVFSGSPLVHDGIAYVPISSAEIGLPINPFYGCCTTSGGMAALDSATGRQLWYRKTVEEPPQITGRHFLFVEEWGPSGAPVWGSPSLDAERGLLLFGTGQNYSHPTSATSDAIFALDAQDGTVRWVRQFTEGDAFNMACAMGPNYPNCPRPMGPDTDFGAPPVLAHLADGRALVVAGQKSGGLFAMAADSGEVVWQNKAGRGGALGGIHWGIAVNEELGLVFAGVSDIAAIPTAEEAVPGVQAFDLATGAPRWTHRREARCEKRECWGGVSAALTAGPDLVFAGSLDGYLEALDARTGEVLWSHDSWRAYETVNGVPAEGGSFDAYGPMLADDLLIVSSGYGGFGEKPGNAFLVFALDGEDAP
ncbi:MAG: PQQ-binding-like beta-propeller repeat protein [Alphaproteobacteria bacterium]|nr:PQQ-binding-like beta-propeller repeat protein [Alphaproteobacteria bacterium]